MTGGKRTIQKRDWLEAGIALLSQKGADGVRLDVLCRMLKVTKGSFYWHFENRDAFIDAIFDYWKDRYTIHMASVVTAKTTSPADRIRQLFFESKQGIVDFSVELAVRHWARNDRRLVQLVIDVDALRLEFLEKLFVEMGKSRDEAAARASLFYSLILGDAAIFRKEAKAARARRIARSIDILLGA